VLLLLLLLLLLLTTTTTTTTAAELCVLLGDVKRAYQTASKMARLRPQF
jgi:hypothetical protein